MAPKTKKIKKNKKVVAKSTAKRRVAAARKSFAKKPVKKVAAKRKVSSARKPVAKKVKKMTAKASVKRRTAPRSATSSTKREVARSMATRVITKAAARTQAAAVNIRPVSLSDIRPESRATAMLETKSFARPTPKHRMKVKVRQARVPTMTPEERRSIRLARIPQFTYMKAPGLEHAFDVGDTVEVFCDHEKNSDRVRGWIKGIVVQVDNKMVAVQFRSNVFLTDGWMVPDRILWYPVSSDQIRAETFAKKGSKKDIPDY